MDGADVDGDGDVDFLALRSDGTVILARNAGNLVFTQHTLFSGGNSRATGRFLDVDGDGDFDAVFTGSSIFVVRMQGGIPFEVSIFGVPAGGIPDRVGADDVDGDGHPDLLATYLLDAGQQPCVLAYRGVVPFSYQAPRTWLAGGGAFELTGFADVDEDGDVDLVGGRIVKSRRFEGAADGIVRQYGTGSLGLGGTRPIVGADGPLRADGDGASLRVRRVRGGAPSVLFVSVQGPAALPGVIPGAGLLVAPPVVVVPLPPTGPVGVAGAGAFTLDVTPVLAGVAGLSVWHQLVAIDPAGPGGVAASNGLELIYGF